MNWSELLPTVLKLPINIYKNRVLIQKLWKKFQVYCNSGNTDIVILGRPAVGKSLFCSHLYGETTNLGYDLPRTSKDVETKAISLGNWAEIVRVIPGQGTRERIAALGSIFEAEQVPDGIIYVVDWGYTDPRDSVVKKTMIDEEQIDTIEKLREFNLNIELEDFAEVLKLIKETYVKRKGPKWIIIAVNKVDLYFDKIDDAEKYYNLGNNSPFAKLLEETLNHIGKLNIKCKVIPISSWQSDLQWNEEIVKTNIGGIENVKALTLNFVNEIAEFNS
ncbi:GTPase domain-containing protein [Flavobacterium sp. ENC]|uniref:GTPase domain-containing protein n=1 Tax=Flavobacterium sp. ENC TaxID=2897330 RepID=UPI001E4D9BF0|nr:GTPase domain-containing protein [Flavobacterium sp. ENC]MCD0466259.1 GTPase domain-containing protein [Flavobacterium sp. ENC]